MVNIIKLVAIPVMSLSLIFACSSSLFAQGSASSDVKINETQKTKAVETKKASVSAPNTGNRPYSFDRGKRDPFVPFGGNAAPESTIKSGKKASGQAAAPKVTVDGREVRETVSELPVKVTATMISGSNAYAILAAAEGSSSSFMVKPGDKVGAYTVQSIYTDRVVLLWEGKAYTVPVKAAAPSSKAGSQSSIKTDKGGALPVPKVDEDQRPPAPPEPKPEETKEGSEK